MRLADVNCVRGLGLLGAGAYVSALHSIHHLLKLHFFTLFNQVAQYSVHVHVRHHISD